jgi:hypothetical protein
MDKGGDPADLVHAQRGPPGIAAGALDVAKPQRLFLEFLFQGGKVHAAVQQLQFAIAHAQLFQAALAMLVFVQTDHASSVS